MTRPIVTDHKRMVSTNVCGPFGGIYPYSFSGQAACLALRLEMARLKRTLCPADLMPGSMSALMSSSVTAQAQKERRY